MRCRARRVVRCVAGEPDRAHLDERPPRRRPPRGGLHRSGPARRSRRLLSPPPSGGAPPRPHPPRRLLLRGCARADRRARLPRQGRRADLGQSGPDTGTLTLATYLHREHVSATFFFVVGAWIDGVSSDPGWGKGVFETGARGDARPARDRRARPSRRQPHPEPACSWTAPTPGPSPTSSRRTPVADRSLHRERSSRLLSACPAGRGARRPRRRSTATQSLARLVGPIRWDVDPQGLGVGRSYCQSERPAVECEAARPRRAAPDEGRGRRAALPRLHRGGGARHRLAPRPRGARRERLPAPDRARDRARAEGEGLRLRRPGAALLRRSRRTRSRASPSRRGEP